MNFAVCDYKFCRIPPYLSPPLYKIYKGLGSRKSMKAVGTWSVDVNVKAWIDQKIANRSQFVNKILKNAMLDEIIKDAKKEQRPKCTRCKQTMRSMDGEEWICTFIHCGSVD